MSKKKKKESEIDSDDGYCFEPPDYGDDIPETKLTKDIPDINKLYIVALIDPDTGEIVDEFQLNINDFGLLKRFS